MRNVVGLRTVVEALFLIAVPVVALAAGLGWVGILIASACAYGVVLVVEGVLARTGTTAAAPEQQRVAAPLQDHVRVLKTEPERGLEPRQQPQPEPEPEHGPEREPWASQPSNTVLRTPTEPAPAAPEAEPEARPEPEPVAAEPPPSPAEPEPEAWPGREPDVSPGREPALAAVPDLPPEPEPQPPAELEPAAAVVQISAYGPPRQWNVWELERIARERAGDNPERDEERTYLLMYLREFADADGMLPVDFDGLVRDSFGELVFA